MDNINWYPGHMKKTRELIKENLKMVNVVIEVIDSRIPVSSRNPLIRQMTENKKRITILNKSDLSDEKANRLWAEKLSAEGSTALIANCMKGDGIQKLFRILESERDKRNRDSGRQKAFRLMIAGVPNVGKSSLINRMTGKKSTQVGDRPGVTKGKQWLTLKNGMQLLDTPGILWPKFEDPKVGLDLAFCGSIKDEILDTETLALELITVLRQEYPEMLKARYGLEELADMPLDDMEAIARNRGFILPGKKIDYTRTANTVLDEFRGGKIGRITLEWPEK